MPVRFNGQDGKTARLKPGQKDSIDMNAHAPARLLAISAFAILGSVFMTPTALAADTHQHDAHPAVLKLDHGAKWQTDAALRQGMEAIRNSLAKAMPEVHSGRFDNAQYGALARGIEGQVGYIVKNCKLKPEADQVLHGIIAEIGQGVDVIGGRAAGTQREEGVVHLARTLDDYAAHFDHPGWKGLKTGH